MMKRVQIGVQIFILVLNIICITVQLFLEYKNRICGDKESLCASILHEIGGYYQQKIYKYIIFMPASVSLLASSIIAYCMCRKKDDYPYSKLGQEAN